MPLCYVPMSVQNREIGVNSPGMDRFERSFIGASFIVACLYATLQWFAYASAATAPVELSENNILSYLILVAGIVTSLALVAVRKSLFSKVLWSVVALLAFTRLISSHIFSVHFDETLVAQRLWYGGELSVAAISFSVLWFWKRMAEKGKRRVAGVTH